MSRSVLRRAALLASLALMAAPAAFAQTTPTQAPPMGSGRPGGRGAAMFKELNLTADQQAKVEALMRENRPTERPSGPPTEADRKAMQERRTQLDAKLKEILTPEQYTKYQSMRPSR